MGLIEFGTVTVVAILALFAVETEWQYKFLRASWWVFAFWAFGLRLSHVTGFINHAASILVSLL